MSHPITPRFIGAGKQAADQMMQAAFGRGTPKATPDRTIAGHCPMGCGTTLFVGAGGHITCSLIGCPRPTAVDELLHDRETEHMVAFSETGFTVRHPLRERLDDALMSCFLHEEIAALPGPPVKPGRYRARSKQAGGWTWEPLAAPSAGESAGTESNHGFTGHGYLCCNQAPGAQVRVASCGGPGRCEQCADDRDEMHAGRES
jgi:hypothetical protein